MLRLLECYVLQAIEALSPADAENLNAMQPKLRQIYQAQGSWDQIIEAVLNLPPNMPALIQNMWRKNQEIAAAQGLLLEAQPFAEMFVDRNLAGSRQ